MGGADCAFQPTPWSLVYAINTQNETRRGLLLDNLIRSYWKPVYCYLRRKGYDSEAAKDLTQGFFCEIVLERDLLQNVDHSKGKFRTLLLVALERYLVSTLRRKGRIKRGGQSTILPLGAPDTGHPEPPDSMSTPDQAFYYGWIVRLLDLVIAEVKHEYCSTDRTRHWQAFLLRLLEPAMHGTEAPCIPEICAAIGVQQAPEVSNMIGTVKRRFRTVLMRHLRELTQSKADAEEEFNEILSFLAKRSA